MNNWLRDFRYAGRVLRKNLFSTLVIIISLAIGIGANSAIFSVVDALLLRPLPYPEPARLAAVWLHSPAIGIFRDWPSPGQFTDIQKENHSFDLVTQSTRDIGVMVALGARSADIVGLVVRQRMELAAIGIVAGITLAAVLTRVMASLLFGVSATDLVTFGGVPLLLAVVAFAATVIPAWRTTRVDPVVALREE
jgi:hypothetical protein